MGTSKKLNTKQVNMNTKINSSYNYKYDLYLNKKQQTHQADAFWAPSCQFDKLCIPIQHLHHQHRTAYWGHSLFLLLLCCCSYYYDCKRCCCCCRCCSAAAVSVSSSSDKEQPTPPAVPGAAAPSPSYFNKHIYITYIFCLFL